MLDNITFLGARAQQLGEMNAGFADNIAWILSIDDMFPISDVFAGRPAEFIHFVEQRLKAMRVTALTVFDEMDHLGLYMAENCYVEKYANMRMQVALHGYGALVDKYFYKKGLGIEVDRLRQKFPAELSVILDQLQSEKKTGYLYAARCLLNLGVRLERHLRPRYGRVGVALVAQVGKLPSAQLVVQCQCQWFLADRAFKKIWLL